MPASYFRCLVFLGFFSHFLWLWLELVNQGIWFWSLCAASVLNFVVKSTEKWFCMSKCHEFIEGLWRIWGRVLAEGGIPAVSTQWCLQGWYSALQLLPAPHSWSSKMHIILLHISPEFFFSSAVEKIYFCPLESESEVTFLHQGHRACDLWRFSCSHCPVTGGISCRTGETAASQCWVTALLSMQDQLLQKHHFHHYHHFLCLSRHLVFCFLSLYFGLGVAVTGVWQAGAQSWQHREMHRISAFDGLSLGLPARIWCWETQVSLGYHPDFICWSERELGKRLPVSRALWQLLHWAGMLADRGIFFFPPNCSFLLFLLNQIVGQHLFWPCRSSMAQGKWDIFVKIHPSVSKGHTLHPSSLLWHFKWFPEPFHCYRLEWWHHALC